MSDAFKATSELGKAMEAVTASASGLSKGFADLAENGKIWTIMSRVISGTGMWQLQNKVRALGQTMHYWNTAQEKGIENQIKSMEANMQLAKSYKEISNAMKKSSAEIEKTDLYQMYFQQGKMQGRSDPAKFALGQYQARHGEMKERLGGMLAGVGKQNRTMQYLSGTGSNVKKNKAGRFIDKDTGRFKAAADFTTRGQFLADQFPGFKKMAKLSIKDLKVKATLSGIKKKIFKVGGKILPFAGRFLLVATTFFVKGMLYFLLIALGIALVVKIARGLWPSISKWLEKFGVIKTFISGIKTILSGFFLMFKGIFKGNFKDVVKGFLTIMFGLGKVLVAILKGVFAVVFGVIEGILKGIVNSVISVLNKFPGVNISKFAMGGIHGSGGVALVGERGPELVNLPAGARVHSNQASRRMGGGNTINVHVNGRVGASDMEIRDIADKVAREINMRMNRTGSAVGRF